MLINCGGDVSENSIDGPIHLPAATPTVSPTEVPIAVPTMAPTEVPTVAPTTAPTAVPTTAPTMEPTPSSRPYLGTPFLLPITIEAEDYNIDGFMDLTNGNRGGAYREDSVDISPTGEGYAVTWTQAGEWFEYSVLTTETQSFDLSILYSSKDQHGVISVYSGSDILVSDTELPETGDWDQYSLYKFDPFTLQEGEHKVRINIVRAGINIDNLDFQLSPAPNNIIALVYEQQCAACHGRVGEAGLGGSIIEMCIHTDCDNQDILAQYISEQMPKGQTSRCEGQCAVDMARYVREELRPVVTGPVPTPAPTQPPVPVATPTPVATPEPTPIVVPTMFPVPPIVDVDQCDTTADCRSTFGARATDCANSRENDSICMCGSSPCGNSMPTIPPMPIQTPIPEVTPTPAVAPTPVVTFTPTPAPTASPEPTPTPTPPDNSTASCKASGDFKPWHRVELRCTGYEASELDDETFTDHRLNVVFSQRNKEYLVPGHFAADGNAAESSATDGGVWRAYFMPPTVGQWQYRVSFRQGNEIAVSNNANAGEPILELDGKTGSFDVRASNVQSSDMRTKGLLEHRRGERYLRHAGSQSIYIEAGMDSPENIFGYFEFDNTIKNRGGSCKGLLHQFPSHERDWNNGDPSWKNGRGKSLIGLVNYITSKGVNAVYIMAMTVKGDGCDAHPWVDYDGNRKAFDVSKLDQWETVLGHMTQRGLLIHMVTQETENDRLLNNGNLGFERKLYYRELISRFGHHPALQWNLGEENRNSANQIKDFADYIRDLDPYNHPLFMHTWPGDYGRYEPLLGHPTFDGPTIQTGNIPSRPAGGVYGLTREWIDRSTAAGSPWVVTMTEASGGEVPRPNEKIDGHQRTYWMWANVMAGGGGFEWYLKNNGSGHAYDLAVEDLREFDSFWEQSGYLAKFFSEIVQDDLGINLQSLTPDNDVTSTDTDWVLAAPGQAYILFLREGGSTELNLPDRSNYNVLWFNPRTGETSNGGVITGPGEQNIGTPPSQTNQDWVVVISLDEQRGNLHPDIVSVMDIDPRDIERTPSNGWTDSYSVGDKCYCDTTFDHNIGGIFVNTTAGMITVREACDLVGPGPGSAGRPKYNDVQCGNGPANDAGDEDYCPGRVDLGKEGCGHIGPEWQISESPSPSPSPTSQYVEQDGLVIMEVENTTSPLGEWSEEQVIGGYTGSGYLEFNGNTPINGPANSPLEYTFTVNQSGLYYLHLHAAKETLEINGTTRTDVANDAYVRLEGTYEAGPNPGNNNGNDAPLNTLKKDTKFYGGANGRFSWAKGNALDLGGHNNKRVAVYNLQGGQTYTFVISGRSQKFKLDRIVFRHETVSESYAENLDLIETR